MHAPILVLLFSVFILVSWSPTFALSIPERPFSSDTSHVEQQAVALDPVLERLLVRNKEWAVGVERAHPGFFNESAKGQHPKVLWVGCSDSRVPESVITNVLPGEIFVERNIANQAPPNDTNSLTVITYAVEHLEVDRIIIAGHTHCGGVAYCHDHAASLPTPPPSPPPPLPSPVLNAWLNPLYQLAIKLLPLDKGKSREEALERLTRENVRMQVERVAGLEVVHQAWKEGRDLAVYGWLYEVEYGRLKDLGICKGRPGSLVEAGCET